MLNQALIAKIRLLFLDGTTPSQLMKRIEKEYPDDPRLHLIIMNYFKEAFQLPLLRNVVSGEEYSANHRHAHYNRDVVPEIIQRINKWNTDRLDGTWLEGVVVRSLEENAARLSDVTFEELNRVWGTLNREEQQFIIRNIAWKDHYWDALKSVSCLAERLQEKIGELERRLSQDVESHSGSDGESSLEK